jgi:hypothetical protein
VIWTLLIFTAAITIAVGTFLFDIINTINVSMLWALQIGSAAAAGGGLGSNNSQQSYQNSHLFDLTYALRVCAANKQVCF